MKRKIQCIVVDDDTLIHDIFKKYLEDCEHAEIVDYFQDPREFIKANKKPDLVFIDIVMPHIDGFTLANTIKPTPVILFTGNAIHFKTILDEIGVIDVLAKPITKERLLASIEKATKLISLGRNMKSIIEYMEFNSMGSKDKIFVKVKDIVYVTTHHDPRNKLVRMVDGTEHVFMDYSMKEILEIASHLLQPNKSELVSKDIILTHGYEHIYIKIATSDGKKMVIIGNKFSDKFKKMLHNS